MSKVQRPGCTLLEPSVVRQDCRSFLELTFLVDKTLDSLSTPVSCLAMEGLTSLSLLVSLEKSFVMVPSFQTHRVSPVQTSNSEVPRVSIPGGCNNTQNGVSRWSKSISCNLSSEEHESRRTSPFSWVPKDKKNCSEREVC